MCVGYTRHDFMLMDKDFKMQILLYVLKFISFPEIRILTRRIEFKNKEYIIWMRNVFLLGRIFLIIAR